MDKITLSSIRPNVFSDIKDLNSEIWDKEVRFERNQSYLIEAASGTGKSSLCSYIYGYRDDFSGSIYFDQGNIKNSKPKDWDLFRCTQLSFLFQELFLFPELSALENIQLKNNLTNHKSTNQIISMFDQLGISDKIDQKVSKLSWGQRQRVAIIRCLCQPFCFIIMDEPISHLDDINATIIAKLITEEAKQQEAGIIITSIGKHLPLQYTKRFAL